MACGLISPTWFFGVDVAFELLFTLVTLALSFYSFKIYKLSGQRQSKLFGLGFLFLSIAYFIQSFFNFAIISTLGENICAIAKVENIRSFEIFGTYFNMVFFLVGIILLTYMVLRTEDKRILAILLSTSLIALFLSVNPSYLFFILTFVLLGFIVHHYAVNYKNHRKSTTLIVLIAFSFLFLSQVIYLIAVKEALFYVIGHFLELIAYSLILINLVLVQKR